MLTGLRVLEESSRLSVRFAGQMLAALGAEVVAPAGMSDLSDPLTAAIAGLMDGRKRRETDANSDPVTVRVEDYRVSAGNDEAEPLTVYVAPVAFTAETRGWDADSLTLAHFIGLGSVTPGGAAPDDPPLRLPRRLLERSAGISIATAVLALRALAMRGVRSCAYVSELNSLMPFIAPLLPPYLLGEGIPSRTMPTLADLLTPCKDGEVTFSFVQESEWQRFAKLTGQADWGEVFAGYQTRRENWEAIVSMLKPWLDQRTKREIFDLCQEARVPCGMVQKASDVLANEQLLHRQFFDEISVLGAGLVRVPGLPWRLTESKRRPPPSTHTRAVAPQPAPTLKGHSSETPLPLEGVRVLEVGGFWAAPRCAAVLAELGAEVIKVETIKRPDMRDIVHREDGTLAVTPKPLFEVINTNKLSCTLNLEHPDGRDLFLRLVQETDIVVENFRPKTLERFGLGFDALSEANPRVILISLSGFGQDGPYQLHSAYGPILESMSGVRSLLGYRGDSRTHLAGASYSDPVSGAFGALAGVAAFLNSKETGIGAHVDYAQAEGLLALVPELVLEYQLTGVDPSPGGNRENSAPPIGIYRCAGPDEWLAIGGDSDEVWPRLVQAFNLEPSLAELDGPARRARERELDAIIEAFTISREPFALAQELQASGIPASPAHSIRDIVEETTRVDPGTFVDLVGESVRVPKAYGQVVRFGKKPVLKFASAPGFSEHNDYVFGRILGLTSDEQRRFAENGVIG